MENLTLARDPNNSSVPAINVVLADTYTCALPADTLTSLTVPAGARIAVFGLTIGNDYWVSTNSSFAITSSSSFSNSATNAGLLNPPPLVVTGINTLYIIAPNACTISVAFYE